jgi:sugar O-acyltransferase (sialic acid O-acetyltransferase NeuD family)
MIRFITSPMVNVNDEGATLTTWLKTEGAWINSGEVIAALETSKASIDIESEGAGYLRIFVKAGTRVAVGQTLGALCESSDEVPQLPQPKDEPGSITSGERKVTKKAELAAQRAGLDLVALQAALPDLNTITAADVEGFLSHARNQPGARSLPGQDLVDDVYQSSRRQRLLIVGGGLGAVQLLDSLSRIEHQQATAIVDDNRDLLDRKILGVPIIGTQDDVERLFSQGFFDAAVVSVSTSIGFRERMHEKLSRLSIPFANIIDPSARIQQNAVLGLGNVILAYCQIGSCATLGNGNFLSPFVDIEHHCKVGDFCTFGPGVMMSSLVTIESRVKFGTGIFIEPKLSIGTDSIIGSGAILTRNIPSDTIVKTKANYILRPRTST